MKKQITAPIYRMMICVTEQVILREKEKNILCTEYEIMNAFCAGTPIKHRNANASWRGRQKTGYSLGTMNIAAIYIRMPPINPVITVNMAKTRRTAVGSTPKYSPTPPQTPLITLFVSERVNFLSIFSPLNYCMPASGVLFPVYVSGWRNTDIFILQNPYDAFRVLHPENDHCIL
jgi:hypothetical protein